MIDAMVTGFWYFVILVTLGISIFAFLYGFAGTFLADDDEWYLRVLRSLLMPGAFMFANLMAKIIPL